MFKSENGKYRLQVENLHKNYVGIPTQCLTVNNEMECEIPMSIFMAAPVYLRESDVIKVRALPFIGLQWGPEFDIDTEGAKVMVPPQWMELPRAKALS